MSNKIDDAIYDLEEAISDLNDCLLVLSEMGFRFEARDNFASAGGKGGDALPVLSLHGVNEKTGDEIDWID